MIRISQKTSDAAAIIASQTIGLAVGLVLTPIAARAMSRPKEELGVWAILMLISGFASIFATGSLGTFAICHSTLGKVERSTLFWMSLLLGIAACISISLFSSIICSLMQISEWTSGLRVIGCTFIPASLHALSASLLRRDKRFHAMLLVDATKSVCLIFLTSMLLLSGLGLWSFIWVNLVATILAAIVATQLAGWPSLVFHRPTAKQALAYSRGLVGFDTINFWGRNLDNLLVGKYFGSSALGVYANSYRIMMLPTATLGSVFQSLLLPYLAAHKTNPTIVRNSLLLAIQTFGLALIPLMTALWIERDLLVRWYFGPGWSEVGDVLSVLAPIGMSQLIISPLGICYQVTGKTGVYFWLGVFNTTVITIGFLVGIQYDLDRFVWIYAIVNVVLMYPTVQTAIQCVHGTFSDWLRSVRSLTLIPLLSWLLHYTALPRFPDNDTVQIFQTACLVGLVTTVVAWLTMKQSVRFVVLQAFTRVEP